MKAPLYKIRCKPLPLREAYPGHSRRLVTLSKALFTLPGKAFIISLLLAVFREAVDENALIS
jgi:hypothetical protein